MQNDGVHTIFVDPKSEITNLGRVCKASHGGLRCLLSKTPAIVLHTPAAKEERVAALNNLMEKVFTLSTSPGSSAFAESSRLTKSNVRSKRGATTPSSSCISLARGRVLSALG